MNAESDLVEFEFERNLALTDLVISYSYRDDSTRAHAVSLKACITDDEL